jgi:hypothetical protein
LEGRLAQALSAFDGKVSMPETLRPLIQEALAGGAHFIAGEMIEGEPIVGPIVLGGVSSQARLLSEDFFAPILSVVTVVDDREAVVRTNGCELGLAASIFSRDERTAQALGAQLRAGTVTINDLIIPTADARLPFGGRRRSGYGVTRGKEGLLELTQPKVVTISRGKFRPALAPAQPGDEEMFKNYLAFSHSRTLGGQLKALLLLVRQVWSRFKTKQ